jgi:hypothetical protein
VDDPNLPPVLLQKIQTTELSTILEINSAELQNGGDDTIYGSNIADILIGGAGNDMIDGREGDDLIFGDNVYLTRMGGGPTTATCSTTSPACASRRWPARCCTAHRPRRSRPASMAPGL